MQIQRASVFPRDSAKIKRLYFARPADCTDHSHRRQSVTKSATFLNFTLPQNNHQVAQNLESENLSQLDTGSRSRLGSDLGIESAASSCHAAGCKRAQAARIAQHLGSQNNNFGDQPRRLALWQVQLQLMRRQMIAKLSSAVTTPVIF